MEISVDVRKVRRRCFPVNLPYLPCCFGNSGYGYGIYCSPDSYFHAGNTNVFNSYLAYYPKEKLSVIVLVNAPVSKISSTIYARNIYKIFKNFNK